MSDGATDDRTALLRRALERRRRPSETDLADLFASVARETRTASMTRRIAVGLAGRPGVRVAAVYVANDVGRSLTLEAVQRNVDHVQRTPVVVETEGASPVARAARLRSVVFARARDGGAPAGKVGIPLVSGGRLVGAIGLNLAEEPSADDVLVFDAMGVVLGALLDAIRLRDDGDAHREWTRVVAHEIRQSLNTLSFAAAGSTLGILAEGSARRVTEGVARLNRLVNDLLERPLVDLSRIALERRSTDLVALARDVAQATTRVKLRVDDDVPPVRVDPERIQQVLANLVSNAVKYGAPGTDIELSLRVERARHVHLAVTNEGPPIAPQDRCHLFDRYYRARAHRRCEPGAGIGLYVCRGLVEAHGGSITAESGGGTTTFTIVLPTEAPTTG